MRAAGEGARTWLDSPDNYRPTGFRISGHMESRCDSWDVCPLWMYCRYGS